MTITKWDDDRLIAMVEARVASGRPGQSEIGESQGYVVRLYDRGVADGRHDEPVLYLDSEVRHASLGIFGAESEAVAYRDRVLAAELAAARLQEELTAERRDQLPELGHECIVAIRKAETKAKEANARKKAAQKRHEALTEEARHPVVLVDCPPRGSGWTVQAALCETEGLEGEPRVLAQVLPDAAVPKRTKRKARKKKKADKALPPGIESALSKSAPDCDGVPIRAGSKVQHVELDYRAEVLRVLTQDQLGDWTVEIEDEAGVPFEVLSSEVRRLPDEWPEAAG